LITWKIGSIVLRVVGVLCFAAALAGIASGSDPLTGAFVAFLGMVLWLVGHWLFAFRHHFPLRARPAGLPASPPRLARPNAPLERDHARRRASLTSRPDA